MWPFRERTRFSYRIVSSGDSHPSPRINKSREEGLSTSDLLQPTFSLLFYQIISLALLIFCIFEGSALAFISTKYIRTNQIWTGGPVSTSMLRIPKYKSHTHFSGVSLVPYTFRNFTRNLSMANLTSSHDVEDAWSEYGPWAHLKDSYLSYYRLYTENFPRNNSVCTYPWPGKILSLAKQGCWARDREHLYV